MNRTGGKGGEIDVKSLIEFLNEKQRDPRLNEILYPHYNESRVMEIIRTYEKDTSLVEKGLISKEVLFNLSNYSTILYASKSYCNILNL